VWAVWPGCGSLDRGRLVETDLGAADDGCKFFRRTRTLVAKADRTLGTASGVTPFMRAARGIHKGHKQTLAARRALDRAITKLEKRGGCGGGGSGYVRGTINGVPFEAEKAWGEVVNFATTEAMFRVAGTRIEGDRTIGMLFETFPMSLPPTQGPKTEILCCGTYSICEGKRQGNPYCGTDPIEWWDL
jgi:hypothetical protein